MTVSLLPTNVLALFNSVVSFHVANVGKKSKYQRGSMAVAVVVLVDLVGAGGCKLLHALLVSPKSERKQ